MPATFAGTRRTCHSTPSELAVMSRTPSEVEREDYSHIRNIMSKFSTEKPPDARGERRAVFQHFAFPQNENFPSQGGQRVEMLRIAFDIAGEFSRPVAEF